jgi:hypothetical protein
MVISRFVYFSTLKIEASCSSETSVDLQWIILYYIPVDKTLRNHSYENVMAYCEGPSGSTKHKDAQITDKYTALSNQTPSSEVSSKCHYRKQHANSIILSFIKWLDMGFWFLTGYIGLILYAATSNCKGFINSHNLQFTKINCSTVFRSRTIQFTTEYTKPSQSAVSSSVVAW